METFKIGSPSFDNLKITERRVLLNPLFQVITDFYKSEDNKQKFETWLQQKQLLQKS